MSPTIQNYDAGRPEIEDVSLFQRILECDRFFSAHSSVDLFEVSDDDTCTPVTTQLVVFYGGSQTGNEILMTILSSLDFQYVSNSSVLACYVTGKMSVFFLSTCLR